MHCHFFRIDNRLTIRCESMDFKKKKCPVQLPSDDHEIKTVSVIRKLSQTTCEEGVDYGISGNNIWVKNGCRAIFEVRLEGKYKKQKNHSTTS